MEIPNQRPEHFCLMPFKCVRQNPFGEYSPCAFGAGEWKYAHLSPKEQWNSAELNEMREEFLAGKKPAACHRCWDEEKAGKRSLRQRQLDENPNEYRDFIESGVWQQGPKQAIFKTSNICNLACRSCGSWDSSHYAREGQYYIETFETKEWDGSGFFPHNRFVPAQPPKQMDFTRYYEIAHNLEKIGFYGGEPFLNTSHLDLLEYLIENNLSQKMHLFYSTNGTVFPSERMKRAWENFKIVEVSFSIDGLEKSFEYTRWPGRWENLLSVITEVKSLEKILKCQFSFRSTMTVSTINCYETDRIMAWQQKHFGDKRYINMVQSPDYLAIHTMPEYLKAAVRRHVKNKEVLGYLDIRAGDPLKFKQFMIWMKRQDQYRKQSYAESFPDFYSLFAHEWDALTDITDRNFHSL